MVHSHDLTVDGEVPENISVDGNEIQKVTMDGQLVWEWHPYIGFEEDNPLQDWYQDGETDCRTELRDGYESPNALHTENDDRYPSEFTYDLPSDKQNPIKVMWRFRTQDDWYFDYGVKLFADKRNSYSDYVANVIYRNSNDNLVFTNSADTLNTGYDPLGEGWHQVVVKNINYTNSAHVLLKGPNGNTIAEKSNFSLPNDANDIENFGIYHDADGDAVTYTQSFHDQIQFKQN